jgi:hypothetical protein
MIWILTEEYNQYDQYGEYFVAVFASKPTWEQLKAHGVPQNRWHHVLGGGGRVEYEDHWFNLEETQPQ